MRRTTIPAGEFRRRCQRLLGMMPPNAAAIVSSAPLRVRSRDTHYTYRQDSDLWYLCGMPESDAVLMLLPGRTDGECVLFCQERDPHAEQWTGRLLGPERAREQLGVDDTYSIADIDEIAPQLLAGRMPILSIPGTDDFDQRVLDWVEACSAAVAPGTNEAPVEDLGALLHELRLTKSAAELRVMRTAAQVTAVGFARAMALARPGLNESDLEAELLYAFMRGGARQPAYECIVGGGENACIMHYVANDAPLVAGELVLIDAGCEYEHYASDVTRTFPVNGTFSEPQKEIYELVLRAQLAAIDEVRPGRSFDATQRAVDRVLVDGLIALGILSGERDELIAAEAHKRYTVHRCSHWLGLDVHDVGEQRFGDQWRDFEPGMVLTIEPGCYFGLDMEEVPAAFRGIGVRIEDDVLVTSGAPEVLTAAIPKEITQLEAAMRLDLQEVPVA